MLADNKVLNFVDSLFNEARLNDELPAVRTPQEGYGIMAERFLSVASSTTGAKKAVADALEAMSEGDRDTLSAPATACIPRRCRSRMPRSKWPPPCRTS